MPYRLMQMLATCLDGLGTQRSRVEACYLRPTAHTVPPQTHLHPHRSLTLCLRGEGLILFPRGLWEVSLQLPSVFPSFCLDLGKVKARPGPRNLAETRSWGLIHLQQQQSLTDQVLGLGPWQGCPTKYMEPLFTRSPLTQQRLPPTPRWPRGLWVR